MIEPLLQKAPSALEFVILVRGAAMNVITEKELNEYLAISSEAVGATKNQPKKRGIDNFIFEEVEEGVFILLLGLTYKKGTFVLTSARRTIRHFPNLNRLLTFVKELDAPGAPITIQTLSMKET